MNKYIRILEFYFIAIGLAKLVYLLINEIDEKKRV